jgi:hypothetical protein
MVHLIVLQEGVESKAGDFFKTFDLVILTDQKYELVNRVGKICHNLGIKLVSSSHNYFFGINEILL